MRSQEKDIPNEDGLVMQKVNEKVVWILNKLIRGDQPVDPDQDYQRRSVEYQAYGDRGQASQVVLVEELGYGWQGPA